MLVFNPFPNVSEGFRPGILSGYSDIDIFLISSKVYCNLILLTNFGSFCINSAVINLHLELKYDGKDFVGLRCSSRWQKINFF